MTKLTIKEANDVLKNIETLEALSHSELNQDSRKGIQQAILKRERQLLKAQALENQYIQMSHYENELLILNEDEVICGIDEVGRGPLAGPVVACAVILEKNHHYLGLNDSKKVSAIKRIELNQQLVSECKSYAFGIATAEEIDELNIYKATQLAMCRAVEGLKYQPTHLLIDAMKLDIPISQTSIIKGDAKSVSIAAASIMAKVYRDDLMNKYASEYPHYGFENNVGYGTSQHLEGLKAYGITPIHRKSFEPIKSML